MGCDFMIFNSFNVMKYGIQNHINQKLNQLQIESTTNRFQLIVESTYDRIYQRLNPPTVAKSKKVKVKSQGKSKTHQSAGLWHFTRLKSRTPVGFQGLPALAHSTTSLWARIRAGELEAGS